MNIESFKMICDQIDAAVYISDPDTYEILYVNQKLRNLFSEEVIGQICFKTFQGFDKPCSFCTNSKLFGKNSSKKIVKWQYHNKKLKKWFRIIDQAIELEEDKKVRFEIAFDITKQKLNEEKYKKSQAQLKNIFESLKDAVIVTNYEHDVLYMNQEAEYLFNNSDTEKKCYSILVGRNKICENCPIENLTEKDVCKIRIEKNLKLSNFRKEKIFDVIFSPIQNFNGSPAIVEVLRDITSQKKLEREIKQSRDKYQALVEGLNEAIYKMDLNTGEYEYMSAASEQVFGYNSQDFENNPMLIKEIIHPDFLGYFDEKWRLLKKGIVDENYEYKIIDPDNEERWIIQSNVGIYDKEGELIGIEGICRDITQNKNYQTELKRLNSELEEIIEKRTFNLNERIKELRCLYDISSIIYQNQTNSHLIFQQIADRIPSSFQYPEITHARISIEDNEYTSNGFNLSKWNLKRDFILNEDKIGKIEIFYGEKRPNAFKGPFLEEELDMINALRNLIQRFIERRNFKEALMESEHKFRSIFEHAAIGLANVSLDGKITGANEKFCKIVGYSEQELKELTFQEITHPDDLEEDLTNVNNLLEGRITEYSMEKRYYHKNGSIVWVYLTTSLLRNLDGNPDYFIGAVKDITEKKKTEDLLKQSEKRYRTIFNNSPISLCEFDFSRVKKIIEDNVKILENIHQAQILVKTLRLIDLNKRTLDMFKVESQVDFEVNFNDLFLDSTKKAFLDALGNFYNGSNHFFTETKVISKENDIIYIQLGINIVPGNEGSWERVLISMNDITALKNYEKDLEQLTSKLKRSNTELEQFAYVASHDLQEPLRTVTSFTQILTKKFKENISDFDTKYNKYVQYITEGTKRMKDLINDLLIFSRVNRKGKEFEKINLDNLIDRVLKSLSNSIRKNNAEIKVNNLPNINGDPSQIYQVFQNLISNAIKFRGDNPPIIKISSKENENEYIISISDNGIGIGSEYFEKIFIAFQRLHNKYEYPGSGIGLAICKKIILRHKGRIWVDSKVGKGSTFHFSIPKSLNMKD
ncbi:MAG: PAS domain S-box protein [Candidatus Lokiarchaeota archaeon]|nr:PAS domain S-box protein [Candidatus Lokiarchaeota archaeon]MBD3202455.1 PAS domain S-box protein [Candidatus Lokiarchaeota archaeon]